MLIKADGVGDSLSFKENMNEIVFHGPLNWKLLFNYSGLEII